MKREIKFRGLSVDGKGWVYGDLVSVLDADTGNRHPNIVISYNHDTFDWIEVITESVGQFTGLKKGEKEIYQDDVFFDEIEFDEGDERIFYIVTWISERCAFALLQPIEREVYDEQGVEGIKENFEGFYYEITQDCIDKFHYKGNIHENPRTIKPLMITKTMIPDNDIKIGKKYRFVSGKTDTIVTITEPPIENNLGFLEYGAIDKNGSYRICFNDELFDLNN